MTSLTSSHRPARCVIAGAIAILALVVHAGEATAQPRQDDWPLAGIEHHGKRGKTAKSKGSESAEASERVVARVNGRVIGEALLKPELETLLKRFRKYGMQREDAALVKRQKARILERIIGQELLRQASDKLKIEDLDSRVKQEVAALQAKYGDGPRFEKYLKMRRLSMKKLEDSLRSKIRVTEYLRAQGVSGAAVAESRVREAYDSNPGRFERKESIKVSHILLATPKDAPLSAVRVARQKAEGVLEKLHQGGEFAELARTHSQCGSSAGGGDLRYIRRGYMPEEFDRVAFALKKDAVSKVVQTKHGFHIIKLLDRKPGGVAPYEEVRPLLVEFVQKEEEKTRLAAHIVKLKKEADIEILLDGS